MATDFSQVAAFANNINQYIVRPINAFGVGGFVFDIEGEYTVNLSTEITDHFVEDATTIQDHIAVKPKKITLKGYVGELVYRQDDSTNTLAQKVVRKLTTVGAYLPQMTTMAQQVLDIKENGLKAQALKNPLSSKTVNRVTDYWAFVKNMMSGQSRQQQAYMYFKALMEQKMLVSVQTPFEYMNRMAIESITAIQQEGEKYVSDFTLTLKEIRTAALLRSPSDVYTGVNTKEGIDEELMYQGRARAQVFEETNLGSIQGIQEAFDKEWGFVPNAGSNLPPPLPEMP